MPETPEGLRSGASLSAYGTARSTIGGTPLDPDELHNIDAYWRASLYLCLGMIYLRDNPLLREPLKLDTPSRGCSATGAPIPARASSTSTSTG